MFKWRNVPIIFLLMLYASFQEIADGEENTCEVTSSDNCPESVVCKIHANSAERRASFTLYRNQEKKERVADLNFVGNYRCEPSPGYTCQESSNDTFTVTLNCKSMGEFTLSTDEGQSTKCTFRQETKKTQPDADNEDDADCEMNKATAGSGKIRVKKSAGVKCKAGSVSGTNKLDGTGKQGGVSNGYEQNESRFPIGHSIIILLLIMTAFTGVIFLSLKHTKLCKIRKINRTQSGEVETPLKTVKIVSS